MASDSDVQVVPQKRKILTRQRSVKNVKIDTSNHDLLDKLSVYFIRNESDHTIRCTVSDCNSTIARWQSYYFKRHFVSVHPSLLRELIPDAFDADTQCKLDMNQQIYNAISLVTINGYPFSILDTPAIHGFLKKEKQHLEQNGYKLTLNRHMIVKKIKEVSESIRSSISDELKGKLLSIMFDVCTKRTLSVLGISVTFMKNDVVFARSLGTVHLKERHSGAYMGTVVANTLQKFGTSPSQVISATADQEASMNTTTRHLSVRAFDDSADKSLSSGDENEYDSESGDEAQLEMENQIELQNELNNDSRYIELITEMAQNLLRKNNLLSMIHKVHCCAHTLQLAIKAAIKASDAIEIIETVREMMLSLRTTVVNVKFRKLAPTCVLPPMYIDIRWNSDFIMVICFCC